MYSVNNAFVMENEMMYHMAYNNTELMPPLSTEVIPT